MKRRLVSAVVAVVTLTAAVFVGSGGLPAHAASSVPSWLHPFGVSGQYSQPPLVTGPDGHVWFAPPTGESELDRIEDDGTATTHPAPGYRPGLYGSLTVGADGNLWLVDPADASESSDILSRVDAGGTVDEVRTLGFVGSAPVTGGGSTWIASSPDIATRIAADGSMTDFTLPAIKGMNPVVAGGDGSLWLENSALTALMRILPNGTVTAVKSPLPAGDTIYNLWVTDDGSAWVEGTNLELAIIRPDGTSAVLVPAPATGYVDPVVVFEPVAALNEMWYVRDLAGVPTEASLIGEDGTPHTHVTVQETLSEWSGWVDSSNRIWFTAFTYGSNAQTYLTVVSPTGSSSETPVGPAWGGGLGGFVQGPNGAVWAARGSLGTASVGNAVVKVDPATGTVVAYPAPGAILPETLAVDGQGTPWLDYEQYGAQPGSTGLYPQALYWGSHPPVSSTRTAGPDRDATAIAVAQAAFPDGAPVVYVVTGQNYPDGLSAAAVAGHLGGPVLLTSGTSVPADVLTEIGRLHPARIVIAGDTGAVSAAAAAQLAVIQPNIVRVGGADRYATSRALVAAAFGTTGAATAYLATGRDYPDALAAAGAAGAAHAPVILVNGTAPTLDGATAQLLKSLNVSSIHIVGGTGAVSTGIQKAAGTIAPTDRLSGADRYATAAAVAESVSGTTSWSQLFIVSGQNYPDAISAGAWAADTGHPLVLAAPDGLTQRIANDLNSKGTTAVDLVGGVGVLTWAVEGLQVLGTTTNQP